MLELIFSIHGDIPEADTKCRRLLTRNVLTAEDIRNLFPFEGVFFFRVRSSSIKEMNGDPFDSGSDMLWIDVMNDSIFSFEQGNHCVDIRALVISLPFDTENSVDSQYDVYFESCYQKLHDHQDGDVTRLERNKIDVRVDRVFSESDKRKKKKTLLEKIVKKSSLGMDKAASAMGKGLGWLGAAASNLSNVASNFLQPSVLSDRAEETLASYAESLSLKYSDNNEAHVSILRDLWEALHLASLQDGKIAPFQRVSSKWQLAGFQTQDPIADTKNTGLLSLLAFSYFCRTYPKRSAKIIKANQKNVTTNYPVAIVAMNVTELIASILGLRKMEYLSKQASYWELFECATAFYDLFCITVCHIDALWTTRNAVRSDFKSIITETKELVSAILVRGPRDVHMLKTLAADEGMAVPSDE
jgi:hypothetical protein